MPKVLIIEDAPALLQWTVHTLRSQFPDLVTEEANSEREAKARLRRSSPDLVVLDLGLPRHRPGEPARPEIGLGLLRDIKGAAAPAQVVVLTSHDLRDECLAQGADAFLSKSSKTLRQALVEEVERLLYR
jgi:CheY-like chemotaxis protein